MTGPTRGPSRPRRWRRLREVFAGRLAFIAVIAGLLALNWGVATWVIHYSYQERHDDADRIVGGEAQYLRERTEDLLQEANRTLLELRARHTADPRRLGLEQRTESEDEGGIAVISPEGEVMAATPRANLAGWPGLMAKLSNSADILAIGDPTPDRPGHVGFIPVGRRIVNADGSFGGIIMYSIETRHLLRLAPSVRAFDGSAMVFTDDDVILARLPEVRGTTGIRLPPLPGVAGMRDMPVITGRHVSPIDGADQLFSYHHLAGFPLGVMVGVGYDPVFAEWQTLRIAVYASRVVASMVILAAGFFWLSRRRRARISSEALTVILAGIEQGVRVESRDGEVLAANEAGRSTVSPPSETKMQTPGQASETSGESAAAANDAVRIVRHDLADGSTVLISTDVTSQRAAEARIHFLTEHDQLTSLPNRWHAVSRIQELINERGGAAKPAGLILFDLDRFQDINDTIGLDGGDEVLVEVAQRLRDLVTNRDVIASLGGDEFLLFVNEPDDETAVTGLARQLPRLLARPIAVRGQQVRLGASIGIALYPRDGTDVATLFQHADIALSRAKMAGRGTAQTFNPGMMVTFEEQRMMESDLRRALDSDELELYLQPQFSCQTLDVTGFEALARWNHPTRGPLSPSAFIPIAERSGLINPLGLWAIEEACKVAAAWRVRHRIAVNLSPSQLRGDTIQEDIRGILRRTQFPAHLLELEVTESVLLDEDHRTLEALHRLRAMDIRVTLDDFGAGYSSLSYLRRFPFDKIKIDKSFVQGQGIDRGTKVILEAMIRMCTDLGFDVVAEGVETEQQLAELRQLGCREIQGFLLGEPLSPDMVETFLAERVRRLVPPVAPAPPVPVTSGST